eukprot:scaffold309190_cov14-Tisochrysis_lutea.AAC.1
MQAREDVNHNSKTVHSSLECTSMESYYGNVAGWDFGPASVQQGLQPQQSQLSDQPEVDSVEQ